MGTLNRENGMNGYIKQRKWDKLLDENGDEERIITWIE